MEEISPASVPPSSTEKSSEGLQRNGKECMQPEAETVVNIHDSNKPTSAEQSSSNQKPSKKEDKAEREGKSGGNKEVEDYSEHRALYNALLNDNWGFASGYLKECPEALKVPISYCGTALHIAILCGRTMIAEELVKLMEVNDLEQVSGSGRITVLHMAAQVGPKKIAQLLVEKNPNLLRITNKFGAIPAALAANVGNHDMAFFLYCLTPEDVLDPDKGPFGATLLHFCIFSGILDIAVDLVRRFPRLAIAKVNEASAVHQLCFKPSIFKSGCSLAFWQRLIYSCICIPSSGSSIKENKETSQNCCRDLVLQGIKKIAGHLLQICVPGINNIYQEKLKHAQALELLDCICQQISTMDVNRFSNDMYAIWTLKRATIQGIYEIVKAVIKCQPDIVTYIDEDKRNVFYHAIDHRQEKIFNLIYRIKGYKTWISDFADKNANTMLHIAGELAPIYQLDRVSGAALQMQREIQWFKEVEKIVPTSYHFNRNSEGKTASELFVEKHSKLKEDGEKWMKDTATACTVVAALIATIMFAAAFTPPGGSDQVTGRPLLLHRNSFVVYMISDALSLFSSCTSLLMFMGILTSRYAEQDFLESLPKKLIIGLSTLFFSIATMMVTFGSTLHIVLHERIPAILFPVVFLGGIPVTLFVLLQFPLLLQILGSTYGRGVVHSPKRTILDCPNDRT